MSACALCSSAVSDATVCTGCRRRVELALGDVPALVADLETVLAKLTVYSDEQERVTGSRDGGIVPFHIPAGEARQHLHAVLTSWVRIVWEERYEASSRHLIATLAGAQPIPVPVEPPTPENAKTGVFRALPVNRTTACAGWLLHEVEWMRRQKWADEALGNIGDAIQDVRRMLDAPVNRTTFPLGPCPVSDCDGEVRAYIPRDEANPCHADCSEEPLHTWDSTQFLGLGKRMLKVEVA